MVIGLVKLKISEKTVAPSGERLNRYGTAKKETDM
jgi:hypothetical protein